ncbi:MAG: Fic family protein [Spirochaetia bacterium]|nr:Fic family protein [Spirochaetia bacterium]
MIDTWNPKYNITSKIARGLMDIEAIKHDVDNITIPPVVAADMKYNAMIKATHYSTRIEGNKLTLKETEQVIRKNKVVFHGRERDIKEVQNYWNALIAIQKWAGSKAEFSEELVQKTHGMVMKGKKGPPTPYRTEQNIIKDSGTGKIVYLPPEAKDVPSLMQNMGKWVRRAEKEGVPPPIIAALVHYQFVTIHPYYDGNGRTARLLATFVLQKSGYGLNGFFSMEEYHAAAIAKYYKAIATHAHHNYYFGRADADLTSWIEYFVLLLSAVFKNVQKETLVYIKKGIKAEPEALRKLDIRARNVLGLFLRKEFVTTADIATLLGLSQRMARNLAEKWVRQGVLLITEKSKKLRAYKLAAIYRQFVGNK